MAWITLTEDHVLARLSQSERDAYESAGGAGVADKLADILGQVTSRVRGKVAACSENIDKMGAAGTIPDELLWAAATIARQSLIASIPTLDGTGENREKELEDAKEQLKDAAACKIGITDLSGDVSDSVGQYGGTTRYDF